jgi:hypothetical protein
MRPFRLRRHAALLVGTTLALWPPARVSAQIAPAASVSRQSLRGSCNGETITQVDTRSYPPGSTIAGDVWKTVSTAAGMHHATTRPEVLLAYVRLEPGTPCIEKERSESERLLRGLRFLASANIRAVPDGPGLVRIVIETVDEIPIVVGGSFDHARINSILLGTENFDGRGLGVEISAERGGAFRNGFGATLAQYGVFGRPYLFVAEGQQRPQGESWKLELSNPFLTDLQFESFHTAASSANAYYRLTRPNDLEDGARYVRRLSYDFGVGFRIGNPVTRGVVGFLGGLLMGEQVRTGDEAVQLTDSGVMALPAADTAARRTYPSLNVTRLALAGGLRKIRFTTVSGFDALTAQQDMATGIQVGILAGPSITATRRYGDVFVSGELYSGIGDTARFAELRVSMEGSANQSTQGWQGLVIGSKLSFYAKRSSRHTQTANFEFSAIQHLFFPLNLSFEDHEGGLRGFPQSGAAGGRRAVLRLEDRWIIPVNRRADFAIAGFTDVGQLWAGDVPYGVDSKVSSAVGVSLLAAYPSGGKRLYRIDLAVPVTGDRSSRFEVRFSVSDHTRTFWREPNDVAIARTGAVPRNIGGWTPH